MGVTTADIVTDIGSGYTGIGATDGVNLTYDLTLDTCEAGQLFADTYTVVVTYTLTASG